MGWWGGGYSDTKVELLRYGVIPDYYPKKEESARDLNKRQKISMLDDYEVVGLVPYLRDAQVEWGSYKQKTYNPNRRRALVALKLSDEAMRNCQAIIDKIKEHPNVGYISFTRSDERYTKYPCQGTYGKVRITSSYVVIVSKLTDIKTNPSQFSPRYPTLSLTAGDHPSNEERTAFYFSQRKGEQVFGFSAPTLDFKNHIFITYSF